MKSNSISLVVPEGAEYGDVLTFVANGQEMEIPVPTGSNPGDVLEIQVTSNDPSGEAQEETTKEDQSVTTVDLGNGKILELMSSLPKDLESETPEDDEADGSDGTFAFPWQSGLVLAKMWKDISLPMVPGRIIELGSGSLGLVGLSFAVQMKSIIAENASIVLTDLPSAMPLLRYNLEHNQDVVSLDTVKARPLRCTLEREGDPEPPYDCILGSDLLYNVDYIPHLIATTKRLLHPVKGIFILAVRWRKPDLERKFFDASGLQWELMDTPILPCKLEWKTFGDPSSKQSNLYFHQTQINIQGTPKALADLTEEDCANLPPDEFGFWENAHIQVYIGRPKQPNPR